MVTVSFFVQTFALSQDTVEQSFGNSLKGLEGYGAKKTEKVFKVNARKMTIWTLQTWNSQQCRTTLSCDGIKCNFDGFDGFHGY